ncbi:MAG: PKD domain-containing protein [Actinomycetota bacterium]
MGGDIIAEKFALLKTRGSNGVACTHIVEDTLLGQRAVVKVSDAVEDLGFDYLKAVNLARECSIPGLLVPFEGGILEEEAGYYLAFPELGEPSLENYLRMGAPITACDVLGIGEKVLRILEEMHGAGFCHLFINTRNVFYRPRGEVTLKDPALKREFFHPLLELVAAPDFSYFSPEVMDGGMPGEEADLYALGRLIERCLEQADGSPGSRGERLARWLAERCRAAGAGEGSTAMEIRSGLEHGPMADGDAAEADIASARRTGGWREEPAGRMEEEASAPAMRALRSPPARRGGKGRAARAVLALVLVLVLLGGIAGAYLFGVGGDAPPAQARGGGSQVGEEASGEASRNIRGVCAAGAAADSAGDGGDTQQVQAAESAAGDAASSGKGSGGTEEAGAVQTPAAAPPADPSAAAPVAAFTLSPGEGESPLRVYLDASASYDPDGSIVSYAWSCGGSGAGVYHVFESNIIPAVIPVTLTVTDDGGHSAQATLCVTLY